MLIKLIATSMLALVPYVSALAAEDPGDECAQRFSDSVICKLDQTKLQNAFDEAIKQIHATGGAAIVKTPQGTFKIASGKRGLKKSSEAITVSDNFRIGSVTKTMVGAVIMQLAQEGRLKLDDTISQYLPNIPNGETVTLRHLLIMRSGLDTYTSNPKVGDSLELNQRVIWRPEQLLDAAFSVNNPPYSAPGEKFDYCNTNTVILGLIIQKLEQKPLSDVLKKRLFIPLGMRNTYMPERHDNKLPKPHPKAYLYGTNHMLLSDTPWSTDFVEKINAGWVKPTEVSHENPSWGWAAGNVISNAQDMTIWIEALVNGKLLNAEYQKIWIKSALPTTPDNPAMGYGIAHFSFDTPVGSTLYGHYGLIPGFDTWVFYDPTQKVTIVAWSNLCPNNGNATFFGALAKQIYPGKFFATKH